MCISVNNQQQALYTWQDNDQVLILSSCKMALGLESIQFVQRWVRDVNLKWEKKLHKRPAQAGYYDTGMSFLKIHFYQIRKSME